MKELFYRFIDDESGTGIVESGVIVLVIAVVLMGAMASPGENHARQTHSAASTR
jgi:Flp pilus assembly pilin Flp